MAEEILRRTAAASDQLVRRDLAPCLGLLDATGRPEGEQLGRSLEAGCAQANLHLKVMRAGAGREILEGLREWVIDPRVHGIAVATPVAEEYQELSLHQRIPPEKDVEGLHPVNLGQLLWGQPTFWPLPAAACMELLAYYGIDPAGRRAVVVGRSPAVGQPIALALQAAQATVTVCHSRTRDLAHHTRQAEILVVAAGSPGLVQASMIAPGAVVLDLGAPQGDVEGAGLRMVASAIAPSQSGVGVVTPALLLWNTVEACRMQAQAGPAPRRRATGINP